MARRKSFVRRSVKMEGWLRICDDVTRTWNARWCALEGGYIWFFDDPQDNQKPQGLNKPRGMLAIKNCETQSLVNNDKFQAPPTDMSPEHGFVVHILSPVERFYAMIAATNEENEEWIDAIQKSIRR